MLFQRDPVLSGLLYQRTIPDSTPKEGRVQDGRGGGLTNEKLKREIQVKEERYKSEHNKNMAAMLERAKEKGDTLMLAKLTICEAEVKWFG